MGLAPGRQLLDVAAGPGTSVIALAKEFGCSAVGVDYSLTSVAAAQQSAVEARLEDHVRFMQGDAERLPLPDDSVDAVLCECSFCTFPDKPAAAAEFRRAPLHLHGSVERIAMTPAAFDLCGAFGMVEFFRLLELIA